MSKSQSKKMKLLVASLAVGSLYFMPVSQAASQNVDVKFDNTNGQITTSVNGKQGLVVNANGVNWTDFQKNPIEFNDLLSAIKLADAGIVPGETLDEAGKDYNYPANPSIAIGEKSHAKDSSVSVGSGAQSLLHGVAIGNSSKATGSGAVAIGALNQASGAASIAIGKEANATGKQSIALGYSSNTNGKENSIAIGSGSRVYENNVVSVGDVNNKRRITNVGAGIKDTDAVNVKQLKDSDALDVHYDSLAKDTVTLGGKDSVPVKLTNVADAAFAKDSKDAVNAGQLYAAGIVPGKTSGANSTAIGVDSKSTQNSVALGAQANASTNGSVAIGFGAKAGDSGSRNLATAIGFGAKAEYGNSVAIGANSKTYEANTFSVGSKSDERRVVNVAAGINATDAVNVSQLKEVAGEADKHTILSNGQNTIVEDIGTNGQHNYKVNLNDNITLGEGEHRIQINGAPEGNAPAFSIGNKFIIGQDGSIISNYSGEDYIVANEDGVSVSKGDAQFIIDKNGITNRYKNNKFEVGTVGTIFTNETNNTHTIINGNTIQTGTVKGLSNTDLNAEDFAKGGRAATEEQLNKAMTQVADGAKAGHTKVTVNGGITAEESKDGNLLLSATTDKETGAVTYDMKLNNDITLGDQTYKGEFVRIDGNNGNIAATGYIRVGQSWDSSIWLDSRTGNITGLRNRDFDVNNISQYDGSGRGATEGQLFDAYNDLNKKINGITINGKPGFENGNENAGGSGNGSEAGGTTGGTGTVTGSGNVVVTPSGKPGSSPEWNIDLNDEKVQLGDDKKNVTIEGTQGKVTVTDSYNVGNTVVDENGVSVDNKDGKGSALTKDSLQVGGKTYVDEKGLNANNQAVQNVADGAISATSQDAVNGRQLYAVDQKVQNLGSRVDSLESRMGDVEERIDKVGAMSAAIANLRTMGFDPEAPTEIAVGVGQYKSETGLALGVFHYPNQDFMLSASVSTSGDEVMGGIGATWKIGRKTAAERARISEEKAAEKAAEIKAAAAKAAKDAEVNAQREKHAQLLAQREAAHQDIHQSAEKA